ncbi:MAG: ATP-binding cassette domain-containing protein [Bacteroidota bacterium]
MMECSLKKTLSSAKGTMSLEVEFSIEEGSLLCIYGKSGAGKTSLLRLLAGLMRAEEGFIRVNGQTWLDHRQGVCWPPQERPLGFVFQDYALFPNMSVRENLEFAKTKKTEAGLVDELIELMELGDLQHRRPTGLSGGQQQRVALARALVQRPPLLLLDEPLSALDLQMRRRLQDHLLQVHRAYGLTTLLVSHDLSEILRMADQVMELEAGKIIRQGDPRSLFGPATSPDHLQLHAHIVRVQEGEKQWKLEIFCENRLLEINLPPEKARQFQKGDEVLLAWHASEAVVHKIP